MKEADIKTLIVIKLGLVREEKKQTDKDVKNDILNEIETIDYAINEINEYRALKALLKKIIETD